MATIKSLVKALSLLDELLFQDAASEGIALTELAGRLKLPPNTAHNLLSTMVACGYAAQNNGTRYIAGPKCVQMGRFNRLTATGPAGTIMQALQAAVRTSGEATLFTTLLNFERVIIAQSEPDRAVTVSPQALIRTPIYATVTGRVLLAYAQPQEQEALIERWGMPGAQWDGIASRKALQSALAVVRQDCGAISHPATEDLAACACPVLDHDGKLLGAVGSYAPLYRCSPKRIAEIFKLLSRTAADLSRQLG